MDFTKTTDLNPDIPNSKVLSQTFQLLGLSMLPTIAGVALGQLFSWSFLATAPILSCILILSLAFFFVWAINKCKDSIYGVALLLTFTFLMGLLCGPVLQATLALKNGATIVGLAAGSTGIIFTIMSAIAVKTKRDLTSLGNILYIALILIVIASVVNIFFTIPIMTLAIAIVSAIVFSLYILYDVNRIVTGGEKNYIIATLSIYLDMLNLFLDMLRIFTWFDE